MKASLVLGLIFLSACAGSGPTTALPGAGVTGPPISPSGIITFTRVNEAILQPTCVHCHSGSEISGGVDLSSHASIVQHLIPSNPDSSQIYQVVATGQMPQGGPPLSPALLGELRAWIESGAPNN